MTKVLALYNHPTDSTAFDSYYSQTHIPLAKTLPGLRSYTINDGPIVNPNGESPYHLIAELGFDSPADFQAAVASSEGQATLADLANFAQAGVTILVFEPRDA
jgi:uncharacterized protein (TIGR02118 family)